jgi:hypothetical protein
VLRLEIAVNTLTTGGAHVSEVVRLVCNNQVRLNSLKGILAGYNLELAVGQYLDIGMYHEVLPVFLIIAPELRLAGCGKKNERALSLHADSD